MSEVIVEDYRTGVTVMRPKRLIYTRVGVVGSSTTFTLALP